MNQTELTNMEMKKIAEKVRTACIEAAREGFNEASMSGLCTEGAIEAAVSAIQMVDLEKIVNSKPAS